MKNINKKTDNLNVNKKAFTLAEVLITLGIVGVVAAMTLPALLTNMKNRELHSGLKKAYASIQTAVQKVYADEGSIVTQYGERTFKEKFMKYFSVARDCGTPGTANIGACVQKDISNGQVSFVYKTFTNIKAMGDLFDDGQFITQDGMLFMIENYRSSILISVDTNGSDKNPNRWGYDLFTFQLTSDGKLMPSGGEGTSYANQSTYCSKTSSNAYNGIGCTYKALYDKDYWKNLP